MDSLLFTLIKDKNWDEALIHIQSFIKENKNNIQKILKERHEANLNSFELAVCLKAPQELLEEMIQIDKSLPTSHDPFGLTALHIGCLNGATLNAVKLILQDHPHLASQLDDDNKSPLHHAVEHACTSASGDGDFYIDVLQALCLAAPDMVHIRDKSGVTPIDFVQDCKAEADVDSILFQKLDIVYKVLSVTSIYLYRTNKQRWERQNVTLQKVLQILQEK